MDHVMDWWECRACLPNQLCSFHKAAQQLGLDPAEKTDALEMIMKHYDPEKYWRLQKMHRLGEP
jgi:hypothetical protein